MFDSFLFSKKSMPKIFCQYSVLWIGTERLGIYLRSDQSSKSEFERLATDENETGQSKTLHNINKFCAAEFNEVVTFNARVQVLKKNSRRIRPNQRLLLQS